MIKAYGDVSVCSPFVWEKQLRYCMKEVTSVNSSMLWAFSRCRGGDPLKVCVCFLRAAVVTCHVRFSVTLFISFLTLITAPKTHSRVMYLCCSKWSSSLLFCFWIGRRTFLISIRIRQKLFYFDRIICLLIINISESLYKLVEEFLAQAWFVEYFTHKCNLVANIKLKIVLFFKW